jgi:negative regulator of sigma E activity
MYVLEMLHASVTIQVVRPWEPVLARIAHVGCISIFVIVGVEEVV